MRRRLFVVAIWLAVAVPAASTPITVLYTNDLHLRFGRLASIGRLIDEVRADEPAVLLFDAGDTWQDFRRPLAAVWGADEMVEWMNDVGYDAMALGNHDTYWGPGRLEELVRRARFAVLCANLEPIWGIKVPFSPSARLEVEGISVLAIGLVTEELLPYSSLPMLHLIPAAAAVRREIARAARADDLIIVVAHVPIAQAIRVAAEVPEIDVFLTGHSHQATDDAIRVGETLIVQSGAFGRNLGRLVIDVDPETGRHQLVSNELLPTEEASADLGRGLRHLSGVLLGIIALALVVLL